MKGRGRLLTAVAVLIGTGWLTFLPAGAQTQFTNPDPIALPGPGEGNEPPTPSPLYPSNIAVSGLEGTVTDVNVILNNFDCSASNLDWAYPEDVDMLLVGPTGANAVFLSDIGGNNVTTPPLQFGAIDVTIDDEAAVPLPRDGQLTEGTYMPFDDDSDQDESVPVDEFPSGAPALSGATFLSTFDGTAPNGTWSLYVVDDFAGPDNCLVTEGWTIEISTSVETTTTVGPTTTVAPTTTAAPTTTLAPTTTTTSPGSPGHGFTSLSPFRLWDTRVGPGPTGRVGAGETREVTVTGIGGVPLQGVSAVVLNVTAVGSSAGTFITAWPTGQLMPNASNLNVPAGDTRPNLVTVQVGAGGKVSFYNDAGSVDLLADVSGYYSSSATRRYNPVSPTRIWDTRVGPGPVGRIGANQIVPRQVIGQGGGVPGEGVSAVVLNVTAVNATADTYLTVWPATENKPEASNLNLPPGDTRPNLVIVKTVDGEHNPADNGVVNFYNFSGSVDLVVDIAGYFIGTGDRFHSVAPGRVWDTRVGPGPLGRLGGPDEREVTVTGLAGVPLTGVTAVVLNVTSENPTAGTFVTAWPTGEARPNASNLNIPAGDTRANLAIVKVGVDGKVSFFNEAGTNNLIADVAGWFGPT